MAEFIDNAIDAQYDVVTGARLVPGPVTVDVTLSTEKIVVMAYANPFGAVFTPGKELLPGSTAITSALNSEEGKLVVKPEFGACYANSFPTFNPQNNEEPARLQKFTNMANFTEFEGKKNGPDLHPTPLGYQELANVMQANCG